MTRLILVLMVAGIVAGVSQPSASSQTDCDTPLGEGDLRQLVSAGVPPVRLRQLITRCGIDFGQPDIAALESRVRQLGVPTAVIAALFPPETATPGAVWVSPLDRRRMTFVAAGTFQMGSREDEAGRDDDETRHAMNIESGFWIDATEVTNAAYRRFVLSHPEWQKGGVRAETADANYLKAWDGNNVPRGADDEPVVSLSWHAARAYAAWAGKRLPTEAEWEFAARAGSTTAYWWGDNFDQRHLRAPRDAADDSDKRRTNAWGIADMTGGVWEWTSSLYKPYPFAADGRDDPRSEGRRSIRGGASANGAPFLRTANRNSADPAATSGSVGFRCVQ